MKDKEYDHFDIESNNNFKLGLNYVDEIPTFNGDYQLHKNVLYVVNSDGYRSKELKKVADLMTLGCSFTFGVGLPEDKVWPTLLADKLEMSLVNIAAPGDSAMGQVRKAFSYFRKYGNPKIIVCMFPLFRMEIPTNKNFLFPEKLIHREDYWYPQLSKIEILPVRKEKYAKLPYDPEKVLTTDVAFYYTHMMIYILEQYCKSNNIKFIWNIWEQSYDFHYKYITKIDDTSHKNYCPTSFSQWGLQRYEDGTVKEFLDHSLTVTCHEEHIDDYFFYSASDIHQGHPHAGFHKNIHLADEFFNFINKTNQDERSI
jgi:hypothetical protein